MKEVLGKVQLNSKQVVDSSLLHAAVPVGFKRGSFLYLWERIEHELEHTGRRGFSELVMLLCGKEEGRKSLKV